MYLIKEEEAIYEHKAYLREDIIDVVLPIFRIMLQPLERPLEQFNLPGVIVVVFKQLSQLNNEKK